MKYRVRLETTLEEVGELVSDHKTLDSAVSHAQTWKNRAWILDSSGRVVAEWTGSYWRAK